MYNLKHFTMTRESLMVEQAEIEQKIKLCAQDNNLISSEVEPIPDGICDAEKYLSTKPRIMWILKEPYDDFTEDGKPYGGGWSLYEAYDNNDAWKNPTWQPMIYTSYGIINKQRWEEMHWIKDDKSMVNILKQIAYINISKMPAHKISSDSVLYNLYSIWRPILLEQIEIYEPQIIIFGNTFKFFKKDLVGDNVEPSKRIDGVVHIYKKGEIMMIDAYHPNQKIIGRDLYVNSIIENCL